VLPQSDPIPEPAAPAPDDLAAIFYTSGTTGFPKGAMTSHANFITNSENALRCNPIDRSEGPEISTLVSVPLFHVTGCNSQLIPLLELGGRVEILSGPLDLDGFFHAVAEHGVNQLVSVPAIYHAVIRHPKFAELDVSRVRWVSYGGAPIAASMVHTIKDAFPNARVGNGFGLTETSSLTSFLPHEEAADHADSVGFAMPVVDLAIDAPDENGVGELLVRAANVVQGYWNKPEATAETFVDGWLHTGDLARIDDEGLLYIVDRKKDMIVSGGFNVFPREIEDVISTHPGVAQVAVIGVPDEKWGEAVKAVVVRRPDATVEADELITLVKDRKGAVHQPKSVDFVEAIPLSALGKPDKKALRAQYWSGSDRQVN